MIISNKILVSVALLCFIMITFSQSSSPDLNIKCINLKGISLPITVIFLMSYLIFSVFKININFPIF